MSKKNIVALSVLVLSFLLSLFIFFTNENRYSQISFKFYHELEDKVVVEDRYVILSGEREKRAETILDELFLGPHSVFNRKLVPFGLRYNLFYINERVVYLDLPLEFITEFDDTEYGIEETINLIKENLIDNIRGINTVVLTVDGDSLGLGPSKIVLPQGE